MRYVIEQVYCCGASSFTFIQYWWSCMDRRDCRCMSIVHSWVCSVGTLFTVIFVAVVVCSH